jgi:hypothetical protein
LTVPSTVLNSRQEGRSASCCVLRRALGYHPHVPYQFLPDVEKTRLLFLDPAEAGLDRLEAIVQPQASSGSRPSSVRALRTAAQ